MDTFITGQKNVTTAGTPVQLGHNPVPNGVKICIKAKKANTGTIYIGNSSANAKIANATCFSLAANEAISLSVDNLNDVWIDSSVNGEGIEFAFERQF
ncbi:MAG: hypothetical protein WC483_03845 [Candidatus Paceibacterota bacterium]